MKKFTSYSPSICLISCLIFVAFISCSQPQDQQENDHSETAQQNLDLPALYTGTLPCADCPGINYRLILEENRFTEISNYQDRSPGQFQETGTWKINGDTLTLIGLEDLILKRFLVADSTVTLLSMNNEQITGDLSDMYILDRTGNQNSIRKHHQDLSNKGFTFFAAGNEPFWSLKIDSFNQAIFETPESSINFGEVNRSSTDKEAVFEGSTDSTQITFQVRSDPCQDSMSGYLFPQTVTVSLQPFESDSLQGCGIFLDR